MVWQELVDLPFHHHDESGSAQASEVVSVEQNPRQRLQ